MSTHKLDVSGARALTTTINDPARTAASMGAKSGDDVIAQVSGCRETRLVIPPGAKIERRRYVRKVQRAENGRIVKIDGEFVYDEEPYEELVLVAVGVSLTLFGRASKDPRVGGSEQVFEGTPSSTVTVQKQTTLHFSESGELIGEIDARDLVPAAEG